MCDARIRPFRPINENELQCSEDGEHTWHTANVLDYAYPGSRTEMTWLEGDRRNFRGEFSECDRRTTCILPKDHPGACS